MVDLGLLGRICCAARMLVFGNAGCEGNGLSCRRHAFRVESVHRVFGGRRSLLAHLANVKIAASWLSPKHDLDRPHITSSI